MDAFRHKTRVRVLKSLWNDYHSLESWYQFDRWLERQYKSNHAFGKRDRKWYSQYLFAAFRYATLAFHVLDEKFTGRETSQVQKALFLKHNTDDFWAIIEARAAFEEKFFPTSAEAAIKIKKFEAEWLLWAGIPEVWSKAINERASASDWNSETKSKFISYLGEKAPLWIRMNKPEKKEDLKKELAAENIQVIEEDEVALLLEGNKSLYALQSFLSGDFEIQDWASQQILKVVDFKGIKKVWDCCAGAGGKTLQLGLLMRNKGAIYASDVRAHKLDELKRRAKRGNFQTIRTFEWQGDAMDWKSFPEVKDGAFDLVFVDSPCTSSGVMRRNPEVRFKINDLNLTELNTLQMKLLQNASTGVGKGAYLCYGTCSFFVQENEEIVKKFSEKNPDFKLVKQISNGIPFKNSDFTFSALWQRDR